MIETRIEVDDIDGIRKRLGGLGDKAPSVIANAINRTTTHIKKVMAEDVVGRYNTTSGAVKKTIKISKATQAKLQGATVSKASPMALAKFKVSPNRRVTYKNGKPSPNVYMASVKKGEAPKPLNTDPKAFIAIMKETKHKGLFQRDKEKRKSYPIKQLFGPSVPQMIKNEKIIGHIQKEADSTLEKRMDAEINNILRKGKTS